MQNLVNKILKILKDHVHNNNQEIQYNQEEINRMIADFSKKYTEKDLEYKNALNKELLGENEDFIQIQLQLNEFMEKYGHLFAEEEDNDDEGYNIDIHEEMTLPYFQKTINGQMKFDRNHPQFNNAKFFNKLLKYYELKEDYEMCEQLIRLKKLK
ncbi:MAG: hypothetical protein ACOCZL_05360 [Bacteroidota bacterium]